jgi:hypothetical protein
LPRPDVIDRVWSVASDGQWHSRRTLVSQIAFAASEITAAVSFLVKYGFAESSGVGEERFKIFTTGPSPKEAASLLGVVESQEDWPVA